MFRRYEKVERIEKAECEGILNGKVYIFEKIDGANASVWLDEGGHVCTGSRNRQLSEGETIADEFRGFPAWVLGHAGIKAVLGIRPHWHLCGEWLVKHTVVYPTEVMNQMYVFDVYDTAEQRYVEYCDWYVVLEMCGVPYIKPFVVVSNPTMEDVKSWVGKTNFGAVEGEGVVVKNYEFINRFGNTVYGKMVAKDFKETNKILFDHAKKSTDIEAVIAGEYVTYPRVVKICHKLCQDEFDHRLVDMGGVQVEYPTLDMKDIPRIMGLVYYDVVSEDMWDILRHHKNVTIDFGKLSRQIGLAAKSYFLEYLQRGAEAA